MRKALPQTTAWIAAAVVAVALAACFVLLGSGLDFGYVCLLYTSDAADE